LTVRDLRHRLRDGEILVGDGAWGTQLMARGLAPGASPETFNLSSPRVLAEIATEYLEAGADLITTNTFGGSPLRLAAHGLADQTEAINAAAVEAVAAVTWGRAHVSASVGPCGRLLEPYGDASPDEVAASFDRQIGALVAAGAEVLCIETMIDLRETELAVRAARRAAPAAAILATMTFDPTPRGFHTAMGVTVEQACAALVAAGADVVGSNCGHGMETMVEIAREFAAHASVPVMIQSNAGMPEQAEGRLVYPESPEFMASKVPGLLDVGVQIIGGCCGTGPEHIRAIRSAVDAHH
jgi:5-methyltetrahydrofolate--homocysteine methyltransferase